MGIEFTPVHIRFFASARFGEIRERYAELHEKYSDPLGLQTALRRSFRDLDPDLLRAAMAQCHLMNRARAKAHVDHRTLFTRKALEQASSAETSRLHASLLVGMRTLLDICSGIGIDAIALGGSAERIVAIEADASVAAMLGWNLRVNGVPTGLVMRGDARRVLDALRLEHVDGVFADPDRRPGDRRTRDAESYSPPLSFLRERFGALPFVVKISPASDMHDPFWKRQFVAVGTECREQLLLRGVDAPPVSVVDAASGERWIPREVSQSTGRDGDYLIEPHNAIVRSGAVSEYLAEFGATPVDPHIAYGLSGVPPVSSRWHRSFRVEERIPWNLRAVQQAIRRHQFGSGTEIKKRGFPLLPEELRAKLRFEGDKSGVLICTRIGEKHVVFVCGRAD
jgi:hypothetical protein